MLIRSQDKKQLINFDNVTRLSACKIYRKNEADWLIEVDIQPFRGNIGQYSTEEKAIKVLDMIQDKYSEHYLGKGGQMATANFYVPPFGFNPPKVFQMPNDEEVEG